MSVVIHEIVADLLRNGNEKSKLLLGYRSKTEIIVLACAELSSLTAVEDKQQMLKSLLLGGVSIVGLAVCEAGGSIDFEKYELQQSGDQYACIHLMKDGNRLSIKTTEVVSDSIKTIVDLTIVSDDFLSKSLIACCWCHIPVSFPLEGKGGWKECLKTEIEKCTEDIVSDKTVFHLQSSDVLLRTSSCYGVPANSSCRYLTSCIRNGDGSVNTQSRKKDEQSLLKFDMYSDLSSPGDIETVPTCSPVLSHNTELVKTVTMMLYVEAISIFPDETLVSDMAATMCEAVKNQLLALEQCICDFSKEGMFVAPEVCHYQPMQLPTLFNVIYPLYVPEEKLEEKRRMLHRFLCLPEDRPLFRRANKYRLPVDNQQSTYLVNVHRTCSPSKVIDGRQYTVKGSYTYHHYMQDRFDDNKWGCAYRSLQTLVSWFRLQGYTDKHVPSHKEIQQILVDIGDKEPKFVGSRQWIGSMEVSFVLEILLGVQSKIMSVSSGGDLSSKGRELAQHFSTHGSPIMIGGGVFAHTILGIDYNDVTGGISFLILDPHYTGAEDLKVIIDKGWCGWKDPDFWDKNAHYNLCMPQPPNMI